MSNPFSLVLICGGLKYNDIVLCSGTTNVIINFDIHIEADKLDKIIDFLDHSCMLFDKPIYDWNQIINTLKLLKEQYHLISDATWMALYTWMPQHKKCGATLSLCLNSELYSNAVDEKFIIPNQLKK